MNESAGPLVPSSAATRPRAIGFIYYYLPSATVATLALVYALTQGEPAATLAALSFCRSPFAGLVVLPPISVDLSPADDFP